MLPYGGQLTCGDTIRIIEAPKPTGANTVIRKLEAEMLEQNKGHKTMLRQIVCEADEKLKKTKS